MTELLVRKLEHFEKLSEADKRVLQEATKDVREFAPHRDIISEGERPDYVHLLLEGWAYRYKIRPEGERSIMALLVPGDLCDVQVSLLNRMDHSIATLTACRIALLSRDDIADITKYDARLTRVLWWATLVDEAILREWVVNIGSCPATVRTAHLLCEMLLRLRAVGLASDDGYDLPLTQAELADAMGISAVHVNRVIRRLRSEGLVRIENRHVTIRDWERLKEIGEFTPAYLHQEQGRLGKLRHGLELVASASG